MTKKTRHQAPATAAASEGRGNTLSQTGKVAVDRTAEYDYKKLVEEELSEYKQVEVTKDLHLGGIHALRAWGYWFQYLVGVWQTDFATEVTAPLSGSENRSMRILSLGCGHGGFELQIAQRFGSRPYEIVAVDINPSLSAEARKRAVDQGLNITWDEVDLNFVRIPEKTFDVIYAHASLHHVLNLEHVFEQINGGLKPGGRFVMVEMIGKSAVLFWQENLDVAMQVVRDMPESYKEGVEDLASVTAPYAQAYVGMEGIRQEEIPALAAKWLTPVKVFNYGSFIRTICTHPIIGERLDPDRASDREYLETLFDYDLLLIREKRLRPTEMMGVFQKKT